MKILIIISIFYFNTAIAQMDSFKTKDYNEKIRLSDYPRDYSNNNNDDEINFNTTSSLADTIIWKKLNGPYGGFIMGFEVNGDTMLAGTGYSKGEIFYSTNCGESWNQSNFKAQEQVNDFCFLPWGGALASTDPRSTSNYGGVYYSSDFINWKMIYGSAPIWSVGVDSRGVLYAGTDSKIIIASQDTGKTWEIVLYDYHDGGRTTDFLLNDNGDLFAIYYETILRKKKDASPFEWEKGVVDSPWSIDGIFKGPDNKLFVYGETSFFLSTDLGSNWFSNPTAYGTLMSSCVYNKRLIGSFLNGIEIFGFFKEWGSGISDDDGKTWRFPNVGLTPRTASGKIVANKNHTYLSTYGAGVYKSTDYGESWNHSSKGLTSANVHDVFVDSLTGYFYAASFRQGIQRSKDKGISWEEINKGITDIRFFTVTADKDGVLFAGSIGGLFRSTNNGDNWIKQHTLPENNDSPEYLVVDSKNRLYCLDYISGMFRSTDKGETWQRLDLSFKKHYINSVAFDSAGNIYASGEGGIAYRSKDDGQTWEELIGVVNDKPAGGWFAFPDDGSILLTSWEGVLRSTDDGKTWNLQDKGLPKAFIKGLEQDSRGGLYLLTNTQKTVFYSSDKGLSWRNITGNIKYNWFNNIRIIDEDVYLCSNESLWILDKMILDVKDNEQIVNNYSLSQNYPNPFNPSTTIKYSILERGFVTIKVYDLLGREIRTLINEEKQIGSYEVMFNADGLPSGIYFYSIHAGRFSEARKMLLVK